MQQVFACIHGCDLHISYLHCKGVDWGEGGGGGGGGKGGDSPPSFILLV